MNTPLIPGDDELEALLSEDSELLRRYRALPQSEPGKHLDSAILGRAGNAVRRQSVRARWLVPVASAASIVAAAGIGWKVLTTQQQEQQAAAGPEAKYEVFEIDLQSSDRQRDMDAASMPPQSASKEAKADSAPLEKSAPVVAEPRPSLSEIIQGPARDSGIIVDEPHTRTDHAVPGRAPEQRQPISDPYGSGYAGNAASGALAPAAPPPAAAAAEADSESEQSLGRLQSRGEREVRAKRAAGDERARYAEPAEIADDLPLYAPADWIEQIRDLVSARRLQDARSEIARFRAAYPSYRLPPDLRRYDR
jgi:hypothetical protein